MIAGKVGSKGELFLPKQIREKLGLISGQKVIFREYQGMLLVEKVCPLEDLFQKSGKVTITIDEIKENRKSLSEALEK